MPPPPSKPRVTRLLSDLEQAASLDPPAKVVGKYVRSLLGRGALKDALSGTWLGHALHPVLTDVPTGTWTSATILDVVGGADSGPAADRLIAIGLAAAIPTAVSGWSDWADSEPASDGVRRVGIVHAASNIAAVGLYAASLVARARGRRGRGVALGFAGAGALATGGLLGGDLAYAKGVGVDQAAFTPPIEDWTAVASTADVREGSPHPAEADGRALVLVRRAGSVHALADRCVHRGGSLHEGELIDGCVECPLHGSRFSLEDGSVERGPAAYPQPVFEVREIDDRVEIRSPVA
jgi:nitrite reductase/ring-hydroxylating ferredoxin subunit